MLKYLLSVMMLISGYTLTANDAAVSAKTLTVASMFGDHMVLQREMPVPVWGTAKPGQKVTVSFAGHAVSATAGDDGKWMVKLPALKASAAGREFVVSGEEKIVFKDVLVGEVWICCGQSNMQYGWGKQSHPMYNWGGVPTLAALVPDAKKRPIRHFNVLPNAAFTPLDNCKGKWSTDVSGSAVAFGFNYYLQKELDVPVAVIVTCWGSTSIEGWMPLDMTATLPHFKAIMDKFNASDKAKARVQAAMDKGIRHGFVFVRKQANIVYNAMLHPVIPYACRGMVWYQGEANANNPTQYRESLRQWILRLRKAWGQKDFQFLAVMLPGFGKDDGTPDAKSWAWMRDAQNVVRMLSRAGLVNTIDLGDVKNIHPADKEPICKRLTLLALRTVYKKTIVGMGPTYIGFSENGNSLTINFGSAEGLKTTDGAPPKGFWVAGDDRKWHPATASIDETSVTVSSKDVPTPVACRYAFCGKPDVNLVNGAGLPAYPFRTDDWEPTVK